ncbi:unnamed protein product [Toxocara canis]|uniref:Uncharacterized protein n=1 Tax=Toxocara canis TaxID=6265 RepID=A0A183VE66_TOXCA|nr:unnamed protein product [Toxocara canis]
MWGRAEKRGRPRKTTETKERGARSQPHKGSSEREGEGNHNSTVLECGIYITQEAYTEEEPCTFHGVPARRCIEERIEICLRLVEQISVLKRPEGAMPHSLLLLFRITSFLPRVPDKLES